MRGLSSCVFWLVASSAWLQAACAPDSNALRSVNYLFASLRTTLNDNERDVASLHNRYVQGANDEVAVCRVSIKSDQLRLKELHNSAAEAVALQAQLKAENRQLEVELFDSEHSRGEAQRLRSEDHSSFSDNESQLAQSLIKLKAALEALAGASSASAKQTLDAVTAAIASTMVSDSELQIGEGPKKALRAFVQLAKNSNTQAAVESPSFLQQPHDTLVAAARPAARALQQLTTSQSRKRQMLLQQEEASSRSFAIMDASLTQRIDDSQHMLQLKQQRLASLAESLQEQGEEMQHRQDSVRVAQDYASEVLARGRRREQIWQQQGLLRSDQVKILASGSFSMAHVLGNVARQAFAVSGESSEALNFAQFNAQTTVAQGSQLRRSIETTIDKLEAEAREVDGHKHWCEGEFQKTLRLQDENAAGVRQLSDHVNQLQRQESMASKDQTRAQDEVKELSLLAGKADELRTEEHSFTLKSVKSFEDLQTELRNAKLILQDAYSAMPQEAESNAQMIPSLPEVFSEVTAAEQPTAAHVSKRQPVDPQAMLQLLSSSMSNFIKSLQEEDSLAAQLHSSIKPKSEALRQNIAATQDRIMSARARRGMLIQQAREDLGGYQQQLDAVTRYHSQLDESCAHTETDGIEETEQSHRRDLITSLQKALLRVGGPQGNDFEEAPV